MIRGFRAKLQLVHAWGQRRTAALIGHFQLLQACRNSSEKAPQWLNMPDCTQTTGYWNGSIKCSWNKSYSQPVSNPLRSLSLTPSPLCIRLPLLTFSLIPLPSVICPQNCVLCLLHQLVSLATLTCTSFYLPRPFYVSIIVLPSLLQINSHFTLIR